MSASHIRLKSRTRELWQELERIELRADRVAEHTRRLRDAKQSAMEKLRLDDPRLFAAIFDHQDMSDEDMSEEINEDDLSQVDDEVGAEIKKLRLLLNEDEENVSRRRSQGVEKALKKKVDFSNKQKEELGVKRRSYTNKEDDGCVVVPKATLKRLLRNNKEYYRDNLKPVKTDSDNTESQRLEKLEDKEKDKVAKLKLRKKKRSEMEKKLVRRGQELENTSNDGDELDDNSKTASSTTENNSEPKEAKAVPPLPKPRPNVDTRKLVITDNHDKEPRGSVVPEPVMNAMMATAGQETSSAVEKQEIPRQVEQQRGEERQSEQGQHVDHGHHVKEPRRSSISNETSDDSEVISKSSASLGRDEAQLPVNRQVASTNVLQSQLQHLQSGKTPASRFVLSTDETTENHEENHESNKKDLSVANDDDDDELDDDFWD